MDFTCISNCILQVVRPNLYGSMKRSYIIVIIIMISGSKILVRTLAASYGRLRNLF
jgi:hypothetical protein